MRRAWPLVLAAAIALAAGLVAGIAAGDQGFKLNRDAVSPKDAYFAGRAPATLRYLFRGGRRTVVVSVVDARTKRTVAKWRRRDAAPGRTHRQVWRGTRRGGGAAPDGPYAFRVGPPGEDPEPAGRLHLHGHRFPVKGGHGTRGAIGEFGAPRAGGRVHEGFDVTAPCGRPLLAIRAGRVARAGHDPELYGHYVEVDAARSGLRFFYAHLKGPATARRGDRVRTSERLGRIGLTGNAPGTPCHLHVELRRSGSLLDPEPKLRAWDRYG